MAKQEYDFVGWATKNDIRCSDGRVIRHNAFADNDGKRVPLVWNHNHSDVDNVLGYVVLKNVDNGVRGYGYFNSTDKGKNAKTILEHGDITSLSIYANKLKQVGGDVIHGDIKEVSLVLAGANPGAYIDEIRHGEDAVLDAIVLSTGDEVVIEHGEIEEDEDAVVMVSKEVEIESIEHADEKAPTEEAEKQTEKEAEAKPEEKPEEEPKNNEKEGKEVPTENNEKTVQDVIDSMTEEQKNVMYALVGMAKEDAENENDDKGDDEDMKHNFFAGEENNETELVHGEILEAFKDAKRNGTVRESMLAHGLNPEEVLVHGVEHVDYMFPDAQLATGRTIPLVNTNPNGWVSIVMNGVHKTPFSKVKSILADVRADDARAKGYTKGSLKKDEIIKLLKREVTPTTIYKKQAIDRDDIVDLEEGNIDFIAMIKDEMKVKWDEEAARAILFGDGRGIADEDKIDEEHIIPVVKDTDQNLYAMLSEVTPEANQAEADAIIDAVVRGLDAYEGGGNLTAFIKADKITDMILMKDKFGHRLYKNMEELASAMMVERIVKVPAGIVPEGFYGVVLDLADYNIGSNKAGERSLFDDFDIDYNKMKYLLEGRRSGALIKPHSAVVLKAQTNSQESSLDDGE